MKILQVTHHFHPCVGGIETFVKGLCINLKKKGVETQVLCLDSCHGGKEKLPKEGEFEGVKISRIGFFDLKYYKPAIFPLSLLKNFDLIHVHNLGFLSDFILATKFIHKKPVLLSTHGGIFHTKNIPLAKKIYFKAIQGLLLKKADLVIADSQSDFDIFEKKTKKIVLLENAVEFSEFPNAPRKTFPNNFIYVGRLSKNKNLPRLIEVFSVVAKNEPSAMLYIVGKNFDEDLAKLKEKTLELGLEGRVLFFGEITQSELFGLVEKSTFCIYPSSFEGFGIAVLELMSAGVIPILNKIPTFQSFVSGEKNGFICDFSDTEETAKAILSAIGMSTEKKQKLSFAAQEKTKDYSWNKKISAYIELYMKVAK